MAAVAKWRRQREQTHERYGYWSNYGEPKIPKWERRYQGRLMLRLEDVRVKTERSWWGEALTRTFSETRVRKLERTAPKIVATIAAMAAAKRSNAAFEEQQRLAELEAARRRAEAERRRVHEQKAVALLDQMIEEQARIERLRALLAMLAGADEDGRVDRFRSWMEPRLRGMEQSLAREGLEERLAANGLFDEGSVVD